jgi:hypothetical protein
VTTEYSAGGTWVWIEQVRAFIIAVMNMEFLTGWEYREWRVIGF